MAFSLVFWRYPPSFLHSERDLSAIKLEEYEAAISV